ncbi:MAG TPA: DNA polymerase III subunit epsilon [Chromatiaceae bacterium]|jgi:DNA polymerase-3 subunit epsilon|nr:DNA polymerase III subunit epsilon [Chromatiaceae bacterium]HIB84791.1 DNA polymerase III subunit epsilon [Chromatiaceae bacterium]HIN81817.1 DNA polymerase III subunit epsilon [Chromatiales bacterium]HIO15154.1 DNA polymerase III subunit epsilon [Chromatiales bacterium]HIO53976.1 DNA polymerase III subunit epsilon [Chromatiales bacterium]
MRQVVLDTETTGLDPSQGHRIIEIGCVEIVNRHVTRNHYHQYINPQRDIDAGAMEVHGISTEMLADKPLFAEIADDFLNYIRDAELIIHNAPFDVGFLDHELKRIKAARPLTKVCSGVIDTLVFARKLHPGQRNSLDALCKRYGVDNSQRDLHGALLDAEILADVYLTMTGGQVTLSLSGNESVGATDTTDEEIRRLDKTFDLPLIKVSSDELEAHAKLLDVLDKARGEPCLWRR